MTSRLPDDFAMWKRDVDKQLRDLFTMAASRPPLNKVEKGDFTVQGGGSVRVRDGGDVVVDPDGEVKSSDFAPGATGWRLTEDSAEFNDLTLRGGIIGNDALANPVAARHLFTQAENFAMTTAWATKASMDIVVPQGFATAIFYVTGRVYALNATPNLDYLRGRVVINNTATSAFPLAVSGSNGSGTNFNPIGLRVDNLAGGQVLPVRVDARTDFANWPAHAANIADLSGIIVWLR